MRIFLTSSAANVLEKIVPMLDKKPSDLKVAFVPTAGDPYGDDRPWMVSDRNKLIELGFSVEDFDLKNKSESDTREVVSNADIIFIAGGNAFYLLQKVNESGLDKVINELENSDKIYIGSSAGSCIAGPDLEPIAPIDEPEKAKLDSTKSLGMVDFVVLPHHGKKKYDEVHEKVIEEFGHKYKIITLTDEQYVMPDGNVH